MTRAPGDDPRGLSQSLLAEIFIVQRISFFPISTIYRTIKLLNDFFTRLYIPLVPR